MVRRYQPDLKTGDAVYFNGHLCTVGPTSIGDRAGTSDGWVAIEIPETDTDTHGIDEAPTDNRYVRRSQLVRV